MDEIVEQVCECAIYDFKDTIGECSTIPIVKEILSEQVVVVGMSSCNEIGYVYLDNDHGIIYKFLRKF